MDKLWLCRAGTRREPYEYVLFVGKKPGRPEKDQDGHPWWPDATETFCWEEWTDLLGREASLRGGDGPVEVELFPRNKGKFLRAIRKKHDTDGDLVSIYEKEKERNRVVAGFPAEFWNKIAPPKLRLAKKGEEACFGLRKKGR